MERSRFRYRTRMLEARVIPAKTEQPRKTAIGGYACDSPPRKPDGDLSQLWLPGRTPRGPAATPEPPSARSLPVCGGMNY
jgi:hypothetical protein